MPSISKQQVHVQRFGKLNVEDNSCVVFVVNNELVLASVSPKAFFKKTQGE